MIVFFQERTGDFLAIDTATSRYYMDHFGRDHFEGRATAIAGLLGSVCTTGISRSYLKAECRRVARRKVPADWRRAIGL
jgi:xanthine/uracil permease